MRSYAERTSILVIDYDQNSLDELRTILRTQGYEVATARTGRDGMVQINRRAFDVVLIDLLLPDISGLDLLSKIKERDIDAKVFLMGTNITIAVILESVRRGAHDLLYKFFVASSIVPKIEYLLSQERPFNFYPQEKRTA
jgi:two-component system OmpR family response regulator